MNIIGNNCTAAHLYKELNVKYNNPFMWVIIEDEDYINLIKNFNNIDFSNRRLTLKEIPQVKNRLVFSIIIDEIITITFPHHINDDNYKEPTKCKSDFIGWDIRFNNMETYLLKKYDDRIKRMLLSKEKPIFVIDTSITKNETNEIFENIEYDNKIMCIFRENYKPISSIKYVNVGKTATVNRAKEIIKKYKNFIYG